MDHLIPLISRLQNIFSAIGSSPIDLPQLVVVGSQSSGKSSVLENIVGRDFLPRGNDIVTRCPLILQLIPVRSREEEEEDGEENEDVHDEDEDDAEDDAHDDASSRSRRFGDKNELDVGRANRKGRIAASRRTPPPSSRRPHTKASTSTTTTPSSSSSSASPSTTSSSTSEEWGEFLHRPNQRFDDFTRIRDEILAETERKTGKNKGVTAQPITLRIYSPHVLPLTLVDLPGITKVAVGDQPADIEDQIREMVLQYIRNPRSIIIAVSPANSDIANSDALKLAREVDPQGMRTLGVITKLDLMDRGTDAMQLLLGNVISLHHGFVGVVNRSQHDINQRRSIEYALKQERQFFANHPIYRSIAQRLGTPFLARRLSAILMMHIRECLPDMRQKIVSTISDTRNELEQYGAPTNSSVDMGSLLLPLLSKFCTNFVDALDGKSPDVSLRELYGGARISYVFRDVFTTSIHMIQPFDQLTDHDIRIAIRNASGPRPALFIPEISFELLVKKQIERLLQPCLDCVDLVFHELSRVAVQCEQLLPGLSRFPRLRARLMESVSEQLRARVDPTKVVVQNLLQCELAYINTNHPDFIGGSMAVAAIMEDMNREKRQAEEARRLGVPPGGTGAISAAPLGYGAQHAAGYAGGGGMYRANGAAYQPSPSPRTGPYAGGSTPSAASNHTGAASSSSLSSASALPSSASGSSASTTTTTSSRPGLLSMFGFGGGSSAPLGSSGSDSDDGEMKSGASADAEFASGSGGTGAGDYEDENRSNASRFAPLQPVGAPAGPSVALSSSTSSSSSSSRLPASTVHVQHLPPSEREIIETHVIKTLISSYYGIVKKNVCDLVPKAIMAFLVNASKSDLQSELVRQLYKPDLFDALMKEGTDIREKRASCEELLGILHQALEIVNQALDYNPMAYV